MRCSVGGFRDVSYFCGSNFRLLRASAAAHGDGQRLAPVLSALSTVVSSAYVSTTIASSHTMQYSFFRPTARRFMLVSRHICRVCTQFSRPMFLAGKCSGQSLLTASDLGLIPSGHFFIKDRTMELRYIVDIGAEITEIPSTRADRRKHSVLYLKQRMARPSTRRECSPSNPTSH